MSATSTCNYLKAEGNLQSGPGLDDVYWTGIWQGPQWNIVTDDDIIVGRWGFLYVAEFDQHWHSSPQEEHQALKAVFF